MEKKFFLIVFVIISLISAEPTANTLFNLSAGTSKLVKLNYQIKNIAVGNPKIADVLIMSKEEILINTKDPGITTLTIWDDKGAYDYTIAVYKSSEKLSFKIYKLQNLSLIENELSKDTQNNIVTSKPVEDTIKDLQTIIGSYLDASMFSISPWTNSIMVVATEKNHQKIQEVVEALDRKERMIVFQIEVYEIKKDEALSQGLALLYSKDNSLDPDKIYTSSYGTYDSNAGGLNFTAETNTYTAAGSVAERFSANLKQLQTEGKATLLAKPKILTLNNKFASIFSGEKIPIEHKDKDGEIQVEYMPIGVVFGVIPRIDETDNINCWLSTQSSSLGTKTINGNPIIDSRETLSEVRLKNNETLIIGGLLKDSEKNIEHKIPILGDLLGWIPYLGGFFKNQTSEKTSTELVITVKPELITEER